jgi:hypothetical protein
MRKVLKRGVRAFKKNTRFSLPRVSRPPGFEDIVEENEPWAEFGNEAQIHSGYIIEELE